MASVAYNSVLDVETPTTSSYSANAAFDCYWTFIAALPFNLRICEILYMHSYIQVIATVMFFLLFIVSNGQSVAEHFNSLLLLLREVIDSFLPVEQ